MADNTYKSPIISSYSELFVANIVAEVVLHGRIQRCHACPTFTMLLQLTPVSIRAASAWGLRRIRIVGLIPVIYGTG